MKHSSAMNVKVGDKLALSHNKDGVLWEVLSIHFPGFNIRECGTEYRPKIIDYCYFSRPTKAQLNAYNKRKEKYYANNASASSSTTTG